MVAIEVNGALIGFYVIHPSSGDTSCWWLGWFAIDRTQQGNGYGSLAIAAILKHLRAIAICRRIRLLVAPDNSRARTIYRKAGFRPVCRDLTMNEVVLELVLPSHVTAMQLRSYALLGAVVQARRVFRHKRLRLVVGPHPAWVMGVERGPPAQARNRQA